jgi:hypothetical protein
MSKCYYHFDLSFLCSPHAPRSSPELQSLIAQRKRSWYDSRPHLAGSGVYEAALHSRLGVPLDFEALNTSMVYAPGDVQERCAHNGALSVMWSSI